MNAVYGWEFCLFFNWKFVCVCDTVHIIVMGCVYAH